MKRTTFVLLTGSMWLLVEGCGSSSSVMDDRPVAVGRSNPGSFLQGAGEPESQKTALIKQGDEIEINVWGYPEFNTKSVVNVQGVITVPLIGEVKAEGLTKKDFVQNLKQQLAEYVQGDPKITASITSVSNQKISVLGSVTRQDNYPVTAEVSLIEILSTAGGADPEADLHHVKVLRSGKGDPSIIDLAWYIENGRTDEIPKIKPGDTVFVPKKENFVRQFSDFLRDAVLVFGFFRAFY